MAVILFYATIPKVYGSYGEATLELLGPFALWVPFGAVPALISFFCGLVYASRDPDKRGPARWPLLIGGLAVVLGLVPIIIFFSPT